LTGAAEFLDGWSLSEGEAPALGLCQRSNLQRICHGIQCPDACAFLRTAVERATRLELHPLPTKRFTALARIRALKVMEQGAVSKLLLHSGKGSEWGKFQTPKAAEG